MRVTTIAAVVTLAAGLSNLSNGQPTVTAQSAVWQVNDEPIILNGLVYTPTRETTFFDPNIMTQTGVYRGVPTYSDVTLEPHSVIFVPVGRFMMRRYERSGEASAWTPVGDVNPGAAVPEAAEATPVRTSMRPARTGVQSIPRPRDNNGIWIDYAGSRWYA